VDQKQEQLKPLEEVGATLTQEPLKDLIRQTGKSVTKKGEQVARGLINKATEKGEAGLRSLAKKHNIDVDGLVEKGKNLRTKFTKLRGVLGGRPLSSAPTEATDISAFGDALKGKGVAIGKKGSISKALADFKNTGVDTSALENAIKKPAASLDAPIRKQPPINYDNLNDVNDLKTSEKGLNQRIRNMDDETRSAIKTEISKTPTKMVNNIDDAKSNLSAKESVVKQFEKNPKTSFLNEKTPNFTKGDVKREASRLDSAKSDFSDSLKPLRDAMAAKTQQAQADAINAARPPPNPAAASGGPDQAADQAAKQAASADQAASDAVTKSMTDEKAAVKKQGDILDDTPGLVDDDADQVGKSVGKKVVGGLEDADEALTTAAGAEGGINPFVDIADAAVGIASLFGLAHKDPVPTVSFKPDQGIIQHGT